jgi:rare lipoprotein A
METAEPEDIPLLAAHYSLPEKEGSISREALRSLAQSLDSALAAEEHETSFYSEKFHGDGTAFGESFDMHALTAAHRTFPHNTLVRVTNIANGKSVIVRINDRGPFVQGRNMDLSLAAFLSIEERSKGKIQARYERLGDVSFVSACGATKSVRRIHRRVILTDGIPDVLELGKTLSLSSTEPFVIHDIHFPDGTSTGMQTWVTKDETLQFTPTVEGAYRLVLGTKEGKMRDFSVAVKTCGERV